MRHPAVALSATNVVGPPTEPIRSFAGSGWSWTQNWYPMAFSKVTDKAVPHRLELFGSPLVVWWDHSAKCWAAMSDECPHRLAPLSEGRVDESGQIECPYHGWTFATDGACTKVPQAEDAGGAKLLSRCGGTAYAVAEVQGLVWVWGEPIDFGKTPATATLPDESAIPTCEALDDDRFVWIDVSRDMPYSADMLLENVLDSSHVPFTHHQTISRRENALPLRLQLTEGLSAAGFEGEQLSAPSLPSGGVSGRAPTKGARTERTTVFRAPAYMHHKIRTSADDDGGRDDVEEGESTKPEQSRADQASRDEFERGFETWTVAYATPTGPGRCRLFARFPFRFPEPKPKRGLLGRLLPTVNLPKAIFRRVPDWAQVPATHLH